MAGYDAARQFLGLLAQGFQEETAGANYSLAGSEFPDELNEYRSYFADSRGNDRAIRAPVFVCQCPEKGAFRGPQGFSPPVQLGGIPDCLLVIFVPNSDGRKLLVARGMHGPGQSIAHLRFS